MDQIHDLLDAAAKAYTMKALADELGKGESTLRNELTQQPGYKLGLATAVLIMRRTKDLKALDRIEAMFKRVAFEMPDGDKCNLRPILFLAGELMLQFGEHTKVLADAVKDGRVMRSEAEVCLKELDDVIKACIELKAHLERYV